LDSWRANNKNGFAERWREARKGQAHFLVQECLDLQKTVTPQNAHQVRVRFRYPALGGCQAQPIRLRRKTSYSPCPNC
jgi:hypothetical protein